MKKILLCLCVGATFIVNARDNNNSFEYSVFNKQSRSAISKVQMVQQQKLQDIFPGWNLNTDEISATLTDAYGDAIAVPGNSLDEKVSYFMQNKLQKLGVNKDEWKQTRNTVAPHASYINFEQYVGGRKVVFSDMGFRFTKDGKLVRVTMKTYGTANATAFTIQDKTQAMASAAISSNIEGATITSREIVGDWSWFPVPVENGYELRPAYEFLVIGTVTNDLPLELNGYIDAASGELLYRTNRVVDAIKIKVKSDSIYKYNRIQPVSTEPLANLRVTVDTTAYYTDDTGLYESITLSGPQTMKIALQGKWARVRSGGRETPEFSVQFNNDSNYLFLATKDSGSSIRHVNAYYHTNRIHDFMKSHLPAFTRLDTSLSVNVDMLGTCNAYYVPSEVTLNFFPPGGGCNSFAEMGDVVYHEYGHGISHEFYKSQGAKFQNGSIGEAYSDIWAISITKDSIVARNKDIGDPNSHIRRYDSTPKLLSRDLLGESHNDGEIIAGSWYYIARYSGDWGLMTDLFVKNYFDLPNGANGKEKEVFTGVLVSTLLNDDDDGNLSNGTPHMALILRAFAEHHIFLLSEATLKHDELEHQPANTPVVINATLSITSKTYLKDVQLFYRLRGASSWTSIIMQDPAADLSYTATLPAFASNNIIDYYFQIRDILSDNGPEFPWSFSGAAPADQVTLPYQFGTGLKMIEFVDFETEAIGWNIGEGPDDNAKKGIWIQDVPARSAWVSTVCQPGNDHTTGKGQCLVTGNSKVTGNPDDNDVDMGITTVTTPTFDIGEFGFPVIQYYRWYSNDIGWFNAKTDAWEVLIRDTTNENWIPVDRTFQAETRWRRRVFGVREFLPNAKYIQMKFIAADERLSGVMGVGQNIVEAAVDDFAIYDLADLKVPGLANKGITIYPNPADNKINIVLSVPQTGSIALYDITGRIISQQDVNVGTTAYTINSTSVAAGQYLLSIKTDKITEVRKITVAH